MAGITIWVGFFACHLDDKLAQVAFHRFNAFCFKIMVQLDSSLTIDLPLTISLPFLAVMMSWMIPQASAGVFRPVYFHAQLSQVFFQLLQQGGQFRQ